MKLTVDSGDLERRLKRLAADCQKSGEETILETARIGANQLAYRIQPFGTSKKSQDILERAVYRDVNKAYSSPGQTYNAIKAKSPKLALAYAAALHWGDSAKAEKILAKVGGFEAGKLDSGDHLEKIRGRSGRVAEPVRIAIDDEQGLKDLKEKKALTAGTAKAGYLQAGASLKSKSRVPKWLKKPHALGTSKIAKNGWRTVVTLINKVKYASNVSSESEQNKAVQNAFKNQMKKMEKQLAAITKKV